MSTTSTDSTTSATSTDGQALSPADVGLLIARLVFGLGIAAHGTQKLFGWFGGGGIEGTAASFDQAGFSPGVPFAVIGGITETFGGLAIAAGLLTPLAAAGLAALLVGATTATWTGGGGAYFAMAKGIEYELLLTALAFAFTLTGPGRLALERGRPWLTSKVRYLAFALACGLSVLTLVVWAI